MEIKRRWRVLIFMLGMIILLFSVFVQTSSSLNPFLAHYPLALYLLGNAGVDLLWFTFLAYLVMGIRTRYVIYYHLAFFILVTLIITVETLLGEVFQIGLAGLTTGGSLLVLSSIRGKYLLKIQ